MAEDPVIEEAEPAPMSILIGSTAASPYGIASPVPIAPSDAAIVPYCISGRRPIVSAARPSGRLRSRRAKDGAAIRTPTPVAPSPICCAKIGMTGTTCATPRLSMICEPTSVPTWCTSARSLQRLLLLLFAATSALLPGSAVVPLLLLSLWLWLLLLLLLLSLPAPALLLMGPPGPLPRRWCEVTMHCVRAAILGRPSVEACAHAARSSSSAERRDHMPARLITVCYDVATRLAG